MQSGQWAWSTEVGQGLKEETLTKSSCSWSGTAPSSCHLTRWHTSLPIVQKIPDQILFNIVSHLLHPWQCGIIICNVPRKLIATIIQSSINKRWLWWQCQKRKHCWQIIFEIVRSLDDKKCDWWWYEWSQIMYSLNPRWFSFKVWTSWNSIPSIDLY